MIKLPMNPANLSDRELIDLIVNSASNDDPFVAELAKRLESNLPCEEGCTCDNCMMFWQIDHLDDKLNRLECGYQSVDPKSIEYLVGLAESAVVNIAALLGVELSDEGDAL